MQMLVNDITEMTSPDFNIVNQALLAVFHLPHQAAASPKMENSPGSMLEFIQTTETFLLAVLEFWPPKKQDAPKKAPQLKKEAEQTAQDMMRKLLIVQHVPKMLFQLLLKVQGQAPQM